MFGRQRAAHPPPNPQRRRRLPMSPPNNSDPAVCASIGRLVETLDRRYRSPAERLYLDLHLRSGATVFGLHFRCDYRCPTIAQRHGLGCRTKKLRCAHFSTKASKLTKSPNGWGDPARRYTAVFNAFTSSEGGPAERAAKPSRSGPMADRASSQLAFVRHGLRPFRPAFLATFSQAFRSRLSAFAGDNAGKEIAFDRGNQFGARSIEARNRRAPALHRRSTGSDRSS